MAKLLDGIQSPQDLKNLTVDQLPQIAQEIRDDLIGLASKKGGHFGATMGVVELTIALHYVFDTPNDKIIWDVGHQAYAHKILTGRRDRIQSIRQYHGLAPFCRRDESPYDTFGAGHASTSIPVGVGIAEAYKLKGLKNKVIPVIGDGSMTGGSAYEGLNNAGFTDLNMMVVFNENSMSIDPNVGALFNFVSSLVSRKMTSPLLMKLRDNVKKFLGQLPKGGELIQAVQHTEESLMGLITPGMIFESMGFFYVGPLSGYDFPRLVETFENVKNMQRPVLVHVRTVKGKGYAPAEADQVWFHGPAPFDVETGKALPAKPKPPTYTKIFSDAICKLAEENPKIYGLTPAMPTGGGMKKFSDKFPERFRDVGIAEPTCVMMGAGLATEGYIPICSIYSTFLQRAYDQMIHDVALQNLPVVFILDRGGIVGADGPTHHGLFDYSYIRCIPNFVIMSPKDENELQHMLKTAVECGKPVSVRYPRGEALGIPLDTEFKTLPIGKAEMMVDHLDANLAIIAIGEPVYPCMAAAEELEKEYGIKACVVNARFVKPLDEELLVRLAKRCRNIVTVEENVSMGGFGSAVSECLLEHDVPNIRVKRIAVGDCFVEHGSQAELRRDHRLDQAGILQQILEFLPGHTQKKAKPLQRVANV